jgi:hypothetical protein
MWSTDMVIASILEDIGGYSSEIGKG